METMHFDILAQAEEFLGEKKYASKLEKMRDAYEKQLYFIAFIGQFSSGKSCLINNVLGRELLPAGSVETTPIITYIKYGNPEGGVLVYQDGSVEKIAIEDITNITQTAMESQWEENPPEYLEISIDESILKDGMIIMDTPGINTMIEKHEKLFADTLDTAAAVVYVAGGAPSQVDAEKLKLLESCGLNTVYVRTRCDKINNNEETLEDAMNADAEALSSCGVADCARFYVSNIKDAPQYENISAFVDFLTTRGKNLNEELTKALFGQLKAKANYILNALNTRRDELVQAQEHNKVAIEEKRAEIERKIKGLEKNIKRTDDTFDNMVESTRVALMNDAKNVLGKKAADAAKKIRGSNATQDEMTLLKSSVASDFFAEASRIINGYVDPAIAEINGEISTCVDDIEFLEIPVDEGYVEIVAKQDERLNEYRLKIDAIKQKEIEYADAIMDMVGSEDYKKLIEDLKQAEAELAEIKSIREDLPPYEPRMIDAPPDEVQPSQVWKIIGNIADWALIFLPIAGAVKGGLKAANVSGAAAKGASAATKVGATAAAKLPKAFSTTMNAVSKIGTKIAAGAAVAGNAAAKVVDGVQKGVQNAKDVVNGDAKDIVSAVKDLHGLAYESAEDDEALQPPNTVLDYLSLEYWLGEMGRRFDDNPKKVIDLEYERMENEKRSELVKIHREKARIKAEKEKELGIYQEEADKIDRQHKEQLAEKEYVEKEMQRYEQRLKEKAKKEALIKWREENAQSFKIELEERVNEIIDSFAADLEPRLTTYRLDRSAAYRQKLEEAKNALDSLANADDNQIKSDLTHADGLIKNIGELYGE